MLLDPAAQTEKIILLNRGTAAVIAVVGLVITAILIGWFLYKKNRVIS
jgi:hypothetical protein